MDACQRPLERVKCFLCNCRLHPSQTGIAGVLLSDQRQALLKELFNRFQRMIPLVEHIIQTYGNWGNYLMPSEWKVAN